MRKFVGALLAILPLLGETRELSLYPVHSAVGGFTLAAEYLVHSLPTESGSIFVEDYLVVDAAFFAPRVRAVLSAAHFKLRVNGKTMILPQTPAWIAASIKDPAWIGQKPQLTMGGGIGNAGVILGQPPPVERFPGDPTARRPLPPGTPARVEKQEAPLEERIERAAMPEGERALPAGGLLFFAFKGKMKSIKSLELVYEGPAGKAVLPLL